MFLPPNARIDVTMIACARLIEDSNPSWSTKATLATHNVVEVVLEDFKVLSVIDNQYARMFASQIVTRIPLVEPVSQALEDFKQCYPTNKSLSTLAKLDVPQKEDYKLLSGTQPPQPQMLWPKSVKLSALAKPPTNQ